LGPSTWFRPKAYWLRHLREDSSAQVNELREAESSHQKALAEIRGALQDRLIAIQTRTQSEIELVRERYQEQLRSTAETLREVEVRCGRSAASWEGLDWMQLPAVGAPIPKLVRIGTLAMEAGTTTLSFPALVPICGRNVVFEGPASSLGPAIGAVNSLALKLLASMPPGRLRLLLIDPTGLGKHVAGFLHLLDSSPRIVTQGAWFQPHDIEERLEELAGHIATITQNVLRTKYETIEDFHADAGDVAEPYRFLVVINFPHNFTERSMRELVSILSNGPRAGVLCAIVVDTSAPMPYGFDANVLKHNVVRFSSRGDRFVWSDADFEDLTLQLDSPPLPGPCEALVRSIGEAAQQAETVKVPFDSISLPRTEWWKGTTREELRVALGRTGARDILSLGLGKDLAQHVLIAGRPGSGKSTLLHVLVANVVTSYSPREVNLYLIDFKEGVEFKQYSSLRLPHVRVVAIHSEREFGLSVLRELHNELLRRAAEYRRAGGGQSVAEFRGKTGNALPRILLIVDEFQKFFIEDDRIAADATQLLDILIRQGRAFGIHVLLSSQTLAGAFSLPKSTLDLVTIRIALQCSEADSRLILGDSNSAAAQLARPGEGVYNSANGAAANNVLFQVAWLSESERAERLSPVAAMPWDDRADVIVFDGDEPVSLENNLRVRDILASGAFASAGSFPEAWLGEPVIIKPPTTAHFGAREGRHLVIVGRDEDSAASVIVSAMVSLSLQHPPSVARFLIADLSGESSSWSRAVAALVGGVPSVFEVQRQRRIAPVLSTSVAFLDGNTQEQELPRRVLYVVLFGLQRIHDLDETARLYADRDDRTDASESAGENLSRILRFGPEAGVHLICWADSVGAVKRCMGRQGSAEVGMRVALPMQGHESDELLGSPSASRLKSGRALFVDNLHPNEQEMFRPYELPSQSWMSGVVRRLKEKAG
jgi:energy-coupling factor transporter ATP-binding protein EcfA2